MPIRDIVLVTLVVMALPVAVRHPYFGVLVYSWLGFMNPHRLTWGFAFSLPLVFAVAVATLIGLAMTRDRRPLPGTREVLLLAGLWAVYGWSTLFATHPEAALPQLVQVSKIIFMIFVTVLLFQDRERLRLLLLVTALSIGFYGFKGGLWGLLTGGMHRVYGPAETFIADNNTLGLAMNMVLPLLFYLARSEPRRWLRWTLRVTLFLTVIAVTLTFSRSALLGLLVVGTMLLLATRFKALILPAAIVGVVLLAAFLPEHWFNRMETIATYQEDRSAMSRLDAWWVGWQLAMDHPLTGAGFGAFSRDAFEKYMPGYGNWVNAHSIYFNVLGEHGFPGIVLFLGLIVSTMLSLQTIRRSLRQRPDARWLGEWARMVQISLVAYLVSGAFLSLSYYDLFYFMIGIAIILKRLHADLAVAPAEAQPAAPPPAAPRQAAARPRYGLPRLRPAGSER